MAFKFYSRKIGPLSEQEMLEKFIASGDLEILGSLYGLYTHLVYGVCLKYLKDRDEARDAVMQLFEKLITEIPKQEIDNFRSWLHVVTKNYCLMQLRSRKAADEKLRLWINDPENFMEIGNDLHPIDSDEHDLEEALRDCIERLKDEQKECIRQFYYEDRCYNEIAANLGMDVKKVKSHLQNGKRNLKLCLEEKDERERQKR